MGANVPRNGNGCFYIRAPLLGNTFGNVHLGENHWFVLGLYLSDLLDYYNLELEI